MQKVTVYKLIEPSSQEEIIRYIGLTTYPLKARLKNHLIDPTNPEKKQWIQKLKKEGRQPIIKTIFTIQYQEWDNIYPNMRLIEKYYINKYKKTLFNYKNNSLKIKSKHLHTANLRTKTLGNNNKV